MGLDFRYTGLPRGYTQKIVYGTAAQNGITAASGKKLYITAIMNTGTGSSTSSFTIDGVSAAFVFPAAASLSFPFPLECDSFEAGNAYTTVIYVEAAAL